MGWSKVDRGNLSGTDHNAPIRRVAFTIRRPGAASGISVKKLIVARRHDDPALAVVNDDVGAVGFAEAWCALEDFFGVHGNR